jgi:hypothetical protein
MSQPSFVSVWSCSPRSTPSAITSKSKTRAKAIMGFKSCSLWESLPKPRIIDRSNFTALKGRPRRR